MELVSSHFTEVLEPNDLRASFQQFTDELKIEIDGLIPRGAIKVVKRESLLSDANVLGARFVLAIKKCRKTKGEI